MTAYLEQGQINLILLAEIERGGKYCRAASNFPITNKLIPLRLNELLGRARRRLILRYLGTMRVACVNTNCHRPSRFMYTRFARKSPPISCPLRIIVERSLDRTIAVFP